jgi:hypothetical protein
MIRKVKRRQKRHERRQELEGRGKKLQKLKSITYKIISPVREAVVRAWAKLRDDAVEELRDRTLPALKKKALQKLIKEANKHLQRV